MLAASACKYTTEEDGIIYRVQVKHVDSQNQGFVEKSLTDWKPSAEGWNNNGLILLFSRKFSDTETWDEWVSGFKSFNLRILDRDGKSKKEIKVASNVVEVTANKRVCSKCDKPGHNARTCKHGLEDLSTISMQSNIKNQPSKLQTNIVRSLQRSCSSCGALGHNTRTCTTKT